MLAQISHVQRVCRQPGIGRHDRGRHHIARVDQVGHMPVVGILAAQPGKVRTCALGPPQHRVIILRFRRQRIGTIAFHLVAQGADHLAVAGVTALADVDVAPGQFEGRVDPHVGQGFHRVVDGEQGGNLDQTADAGGQDDGHDKADRVLFKIVVRLEQGHGPTPPLGGKRVHRRPHRARRAPSARCSQPPHRCPPETARRRSPGRCSRGAWPPCCR